MVRLSVNEVTTYRWTFEEDVTHYQAAGISAMGVWRQKLSDFGEEKGIELLQETGLQESNLLWAGGFTGSDGRSFRDSITDGIEAIRLAAAMKAECLVVYSGSRGGHTHNHARRLFIEAISSLIPHAAEHGVPLAIEPMHPDCAADATFLTELDDVLEVLDKLDSPEAGLVFDTYHLGFNGSVLERIPEIIDRIRIVHLGDGKEPPEREQNRCRLGDGVIPLQEIIRALTAAGYSGYYDVELIGEDVSGEDYHELIQQSKQTFEALRG
ncbi:MAG: sugar phosphate isomerase/epimerase [Planctomycetales bacterium]